MIAPVHTQRGEHRGVGLWGIFYPISAKAVLFYWFMKPFKKFKRKDWYLTSYIMALILEHLFHFFLNLYEQQLKI